MPPKPEMVKATVTADSGIFKNGKLHKKGAKVELEKSAAQRLAANGDVKLASKG